jgi:nucleoside-triphosphatase THEP1
MASEHSDRPGRYVLLLTGAPGVGKTTVIRRVATLLETRQLRGFYTEEIREGGERRGFRLLAFRGRSGSSRIPGSRRATTSGSTV